jgi:hypothetical protein
MRTPHSSTRKGKRVKITTRDGVIYIGKFQDKKSGVIILSDVYSYSHNEILQQDITGYASGYVRFPMKDVRSFSIYKPLCQKEP